QASQLGGTPAAFTGDQFKFGAALADDERLDDALFLDGIGEVLQGLGGKIFARLKWAGMDAANGDPLDAVTWIDGKGISRWRSRGWRGGFGGGGDTAQQRSETTA